MKRLGEPGQKDVTGEGGRGGEGGNGLERDWAMLCTILG